MSQYSALKAIINQNITTNGQGDITGAVLNSLLKDMVDSLGAYYQFAGVATPSTNPGNPDQNVFYIAITGGSYTNFGNVVIPNGITIFKWNGSWTNQILFAGDGGVFDITAYNGDTKYADLTTALGTDGANVPQYLRKGGISVKFVMSSDNKYVKYRLMADTWSTDVTDWQGVDDAPTAGSNNLVKSGGVYEEFSQLDKKLANITTWQSSVTNGQYVTSQGVLVQQSLYSVARGILKAGQMIKISARGYLTTVAMISVQSGNTYEVKVASLDSTTRYYYWTNDTGDDVQIAVSYETKYGLVAYVEDYKLGKALKQTNMFISSWKGFSVTSGQYIHRNGFVASSSPFSVARGTLKAGQTIGIIARGYGTAVAMISVQLGDTYDVKEISIDSTTREYYWANNTSSDVQIAVSYETQYGLTANILSTGMINIGEESIKWNPIAAFSSLVCVGDSLTFSQVYTSASASRQAYRPYPQILSKLCGNEYEILAAGGATAKSCWNSFGTQVVAKVNPLAIIYLGTNEGISDTLDTDVVGDNPNSWTDNNIGCYCRFVQKFKSLGYKVLLLKIWTTSGTGSSDLSNTNSAIDHIASRFGCAVMNVPVTSDLLYHYWPDLSGSNSVHYNDLGYAWFASQLIEMTGTLPSNQIKLLIPNA